MRMRTIRKHYETLERFFSEVGNLDNGDSVSSDAFCGGTYAEAKATMYAWHKPFDRLTDNRTMAQCQTVNAWSDYDGDCIDMERFYDGRPCLSRRVKVGGTRQNTRRIVVKYVDLVFSCSVSAAEITTKALKIMAEVDGIEQAGDRAEIVGRIACDNWTNEGDAVRLSVCVKRANEPLNIARVAAIMAPWFLRRWFFCWQDEYARKHNRSVRCGRGKVGDFASDPSK